jgi:DNA-binding response OmpR family regulator
MGIPTVLMVGTEHLSSVGEYLRLGSVVVIAPTSSLLSRWQQEGSPALAAPPEPERGLQVDILGRRLQWMGAVVPLTDLEFRVAARLGSEPGRAWSHRELRHAGWGDGPGLPVDVFAVRSVIQRIRRKLRALGATVRIEAVRGYGFRLETAGPDSDPSRTEPDQALRPRTGGTARGK